MLSSLAKIKDSNPNMSTIKAEGRMGKFVKVDLMEGMAWRIVTLRRAGRGRWGGMFGGGIWMMFEVMVDEQALCELDGGDEMPKAWA
ncbi:hypothetical protein TSUD_210360 [Trifolium subterraneum]|uniref:Uncharacterized protein n=1 Tax=Trifolium subterraneum TaxID=3900 RepID=A0A2Z6MNV1_TRISU|nr:hypothetical protein TSUD_210360 [Trifolium subterraneum]